MTVSLALLAFGRALHADDATDKRFPVIEWDAGTLRLVARGGDYGRMTRLADGATACVYDRDRKMWIRRSADDGFTWDEPRLVAEEAVCWLTNADLLCLTDGTLLYLWNERPIEALDYQHKPAPPGKLTRPFRIRMARSTDHGRTWSPPRTLYTAGLSYQDGCWEPAAVQLPSGEIHVYFANEFPYQTSAEQEISLRRSRDGGATWSDAERVSLRARHRDGMPSPLMLADGRGIAVAIEDNGLCGDAFKPAIVHTPLEDNWRRGAVGGESPHRWSALAVPLQRHWYAGAPFLRQLPSGHTILSFQESENGSLHRCRMAVCIGDRDARSFTNKTYPLPPPQRGNQAWNSLFVKNAATITAISTAAFDDVRGIWAIDGNIRPPAR